MSATHEFCFFCNWCHKFFTRKIPATRPIALNEKYIACSPECQKKLSSVFQSKEWQALSEKERMLCGGRSGMRQWYENREAERVLKVKKYLQANKRSQMAKVPRYVPKKAETILKAHSEVLGNDPESLSPEFIENIMGNKSTS
jgi:hypothetical protein